MTEAAPEQLITTSPLERARLITNERKPFEIYVAMTKLVLNAWYKKEYPTLDGPSRRDLIDSNFYEEAYDSFMLDYGGDYETDRGIYELVETYEAFIES